MPVNLDVQLFLQPPTIAQFTKMCKQRGHFLDKCVRIMTSRGLIRNLSKLIGPYVIHQSDILTSNRPSDSVHLFADLNCWVLSIWGK